MTAPFTLHHPSRTMPHMPVSLPAMVDLRLDPGGDFILSWTEAPGARNKSLRRDEIAHIAETRRRGAPPLTIVLQLGPQEMFGGKRLVSPAELIDVLERAKAMPELVMVSCCHSAEVRGSAASFAAELVAAGVPNVLGWTRPVRDDLATLAASVLFEQLAAGKTPVEAAQVARERMRRIEEGASVPSHAWATLSLASGSAAGFRIDDRAEPLSERIDRDEIYKLLGSHMRVLKTGFVGR